MKNKNGDRVICEDIDFVPGPCGPLTEKRKREIARALKASSLEKPMTKRFYDEAPTDRTTMIYLTIAAFLFILSGLHSCFS